jgi:hypothetical protein
MECEEVFSYAVERKLPEASVCNQKEAAEGLYRLFHECEKGSASIGS